MLKGKNLKPQMEDILIFISILLSGWLLVLTILYVRSMASYKKLTRGSSGISLERVIQKLIEKQELDEKHISQLSKDIEKISIDSNSHFQKHSLIRFNPFEEAGGDQSFAIALLDAKNNGIVISSLHSRTGTRVYAKPVTSGKALNREFTKEEKEAVEKASKV